MATVVITGGAGFIGSNLAHALVERGDDVVVLDNFSSGRRENLADIADHIQVVVGDIRDRAIVDRAFRGADFVFHEAALPSVVRSIADPVASHDVNANGMIQVLEGARHAGVKRLVYAASSSAYGETPVLPKVETMAPQPISPYGVQKLLGEHYAAVWTHVYGLECVSLRYFNVFGPRQDPNGAYAAVIPKWAAAILAGETVYINGDGQTSRDFCYVDNAVQANLLAGTVQDDAAVNQVYNVAVGDQTDLQQLHTMLMQALQANRPGLVTTSPVHRDFRAGDVRHSRADVGKAARLLGYLPSHDIQAGLDVAARWYAA